MYIVQYTFVINIWMLRTSIQGVDVYIRLYTYDVKWPLRISNQGVDVYILIYTFVISI